jgi:hypothetical protein
MRRGQPKHTRSSNQRLTLDVARDLCHGAIAGCVVTLIENDEAEIMQAHKAIVKALLQDVMDDHHDLIC